MTVSLQSSTPTHLCQGQENDLKSNSQFVGLLAEKISALIGWSVSYEFFLANCKDYQTGSRLKDETYTNLNERGVEAS